MARTKQTARKSTGGKAPRRQQQQQQQQGRYNNNNERDNDSEEDVVQPKPVNDFLDFDLKEEFATSVNKDQVISKLVSDSPEFHYFSALKLLSDKKSFADNIVSFKKQIQNHIYALEANLSLPNMAVRVNQLRHRMNLILYDITEDKNEKKQILAYLKKVANIDVPKASPFVLESEQSTTTVQTSAKTDETTHARAIDAALAQRLDAALCIVRNGGSVPSQFERVGYQHVVSQILKEFESELKEGGGTKGEKNTNNNNKIVEEQSDEDEDMVGEEDDEQEEEDEEEEKEEEEEEQETKQDDKKPSLNLSRVAREILSSINFPGVEGIVDLVVIHLEKTKATKFRPNGANHFQYQFGDLSAHKILTYDQLLEVKLRCPGIENNHSYISAVIQRVLGKASFLWNNDFVANNDNNTSNLQQQQYEQEQNECDNAMEEEEYCDDDEDDNDYNDNGFQNDLNRGTVWRSYTHTPTIPPFLSNSQESFQQDSTTLYFNTNDPADLLAKKNLMEELWKLATEFIGDDLLDTKAYLMYHVLKFAWHNNEANLQLPKFIQYLSLPRKHSPNFPYAIAHTSSPTVGINLSTVSIAPLPKISGDHTLVRAYLLMFCQQQGEKSIPMFQTSVHAFYLKNCLAEAMITAGPDTEDNAKWYNMLSTFADQFARFQSRETGKSGINWLKGVKELGFGPANAIVHMPDEEISLHLVMKNIPQVMVQVYEIDIVSFYTTQIRGKKFETVTPDINLDGLKPNFEKKFDFASVPALQRHNYTVKFPEIAKGKRGIFIVEVVGGGLSCRTIINRGFLHFSQKNTPNGQVFQLFDERGRKLQNPSSSQTNSGNNNNSTEINQNKLSITVMSTGNVYHADAKGEVTIPFISGVTTDFSKPTKETIAITYGAFSVLEQFPHYKGHYLLKAGMFIDDEQLTPRSGIVGDGNWTKLVIRPRLYVCGALAPLSLLKNVTLSVATKMESGVIVNKECTPVHSLDNQEWVYQFQIQRDEVSFTFSLSANISTPDPTETISVKDRSEFPVKFIPGSMNMEEFHLGCEPVANGEVRGTNESSYVLYLLGRGGEPRPGKRISLMLHHIYFPSYFSIELDTDKKGRIPLGPLKGFHFISASSNSGDQCNSMGFSLDTKNYHSNLLPFHKNSTFDLRYDAIAYTHDMGQPHKFPSYIFHGVANERFHLAWIPISYVPAQVIREHLSLLSIVPERSTLEGSKQAVYLKDFFEKVTYREDLQMLEISGLPAGEYVLWRKLPYFAPIIIRIGTPVDSTPTGGIKENYLIGVNGDIFLPTHPVPLQITSIELTKDKKLVVKTSTKSRKTRAHLIFRRFLPSNVNSALLLSRPSSPFPHYFTLSRGFSRFLSTRNTNPEYQYILNRRGLDHHYLGNSLPFPTMLLQPLPVGKVNFNNLKQGKSSVAGTSDAFNTSATQNRIALRNLNMKTSSFISTNSSFLENASVTLANVTVDENGTISVSDKDISDLVKKFGMVEVCLIGDNSEEGNVHDAEEIVMKTFWFGSSEESICRDMRLSKSEVMNPSDHLCVQRETTVVYPGQEITLHTTANFRMEIYDNFSKAYNILHTLSNETILFVPEIKQWPQLTEEKKLEIFSSALVTDKQVTWATEFYFFTYHKDKPFFNSIVRPYLENKRHKSFIDLWVLERDLSIFRKLSEFYKLNTVEQILLGIRFPEMRGQVSQFLSSRLQYPLSKSTAYHTVFNTAVMNGGASITSESSVQTNKNRYLQSDQFSVYSSSSIKSKEKNGSSPAQQNKQEQPSKKIATTEYLRDVSYFANEGIPVNEYWVDYARHLERNDGKVFLSPHFLQADSSFTEIIFALSVLDLPFEQANQTTKLTQNEQVLKIGPNVGGAIMFHTDIKRAKVGDQPVGLVTTQAFFNPREKLNSDGSLKAIKDSEELLVMQVWGCRMSVINTAGCPLPLVSVLLQVPEGAIPLGGEKAFYTRNLDLDFAADETETIDYFFYFPTPGTFTHYPLHVACDNEIIAHAAPRTLVVAEKPRGVDTSSWDSVGRLGSDREVVIFLQSAPNLDNLSLEIVISRIMSKQGNDRKEFYSQILSVFREKLAYSEFLWSLGFVVEDERSIVELLSMNNDFVVECGPFLESKLINTKSSPPKFKYYEYAPYIHPRVHTKDDFEIPETANQSYSGRGKGGKGIGKGGIARINTNEKKQETEKSVSLPWQLFMGYRSLVDRLLFLEKPSRSDLAHICFYHLRCNRISEAKSLFLELNESMDDSTGEDGELRIQLDYLSAYLDLYGAPNSSENTYTIARNISDKYKNYPILHWRKMFNEIQSTLSRAAPVSAETLVQQVLAHGRAEDGGVVQQGGGLQVASARLELEVKGNQLSIAWHPGKTCADKLKQVQVNYYAVDIEVIFSRDPFADQNRISPHLLVNKPTVEAVVALPAPVGTSKQQQDLLPYQMLVDLPSHLVGLPLVIQVRDPSAEHVESTRTYLGSSNLVAHAIQCEGHLQVYEKTTDVVSASKRPRLESGQTTSSSIQSEVFQPLGGCYVKVFRATISGKVKFYKDGYTDVAGRFDYVARSGKENLLVKTRSFAVLVLAPNKGAVKLLVSPPL